MRFQKGNKGSKFDKISKTINREIFYTTGWTMPELLWAFLSAEFQLA
jgi:hypothetical protein